MIKKLRLPLLIGLLGLCVIALGIDLSPKVDAGQNYYLGAVTTAVGYQIDAIEFDGSTDYGLRGGGMTGAADGKVGLISVWLNPDTDGVLENILYSDTSGMFAVQRKADNKVYFLGFTTGLVIKLDINSSAILAASGWTHIMASWNLATTSAHLYVNNSTDKTQTVLLDDTIDHTNNEHGFGANPDTFGKYSGGIAQFYWSQEYLDLSNAANRANIINATTLKPVDFGGTGTEITGNQPLVLLHVLPGNAASVFFVNKGSGGDFTDQGSIAIAGTSPSD